MPSSGSFVAELGPQQLWWQEVSVALRCHQPRSLWIVPPSVTRLGCLLSSPRLFPSGIAWYLSPTVWTLSWLMTSLSSQSQQDCCRQLPSLRTEPRAVPHLVLTLQASAELYSQRMATVATLTQATPSPNFQG